MKKIVNKIKKWHAYWLWIEKQRMKTAIHSNSSGPWL